MSKRSHIRVRVVAAVVVATTAVILSVPAAQASSDSSVTAEIGLIVELQGARWTDWQQDVLGPDRE